MNICDVTSMFERHACTIINQYHESPVMRAYIAALAEEYDELKGAFCSILGGDDTDIDDREGEELDVIGNNVGLSRCQCRAKYRYPNTEQCVDGYYVLSNTTTVEHCMTDDEYRQFIKAKQISNQGLGAVYDARRTIETLYDAESYVVKSSDKEFIIGINRPFTQAEKALFPLAKRITNRFPSIRLYLADLPEDGLRPISMGVADSGFCDAAFPRRYYY